MGRLTTIALAAALASGLTACGATYRNHGYVPEPDQLAALTVGEDTRETVEASVGRPSTGGVLSDDAWYYIQSRDRRVAFLPSRTIRRELVAVSFAGDGTVANIERFGLERGKVVTLSRRVTETSVRDFGLIQQIARNFGRVDIGEALAGDE